ncbi:MAG: hypothetical protein ABR581_05970, partial [Thermoleophilaceae bacterium]
SQLEQAIRDQTGFDINWAEFRQATAAYPLVAIFDGYDELLQVTGVSQADYMERVRAFQQQELILGRPLRTIVTSRIVLIDKAFVPPETVVVRLEEFDTLRREAWVSMWNAANEEYFNAKGLRGFSLPATGPVLDLAGQPLLALRDEPGTRGSHWCGGVIIAFAALSPRPEGCVNPS